MVLDLDAGITSANSSSMSAQASSSYAPTLRNRGVPSAWFSELLTLFFSVDGSATTAFENVPYQATQKLQIAIRVTTGSQTMRSQRLRVAALAKIPIAQ